MPPERPKVDASPPRSDREQSVSKNVGEINPQNVESNEPSETKTRTMIVRVDRIWDKKSRKYRYVKTAKPKSEKRFSRNVVTVARNISVQGVFNGDYIVEIRSVYLSNVFADIYRGIEGLGFSDHMALETPQLRLLYHALPELERKLSTEESLDNHNEDLVFELKAVVEFTRGHFGSDMYEISSFPDGHIDFEHLWTVFRPGILVISVGHLNETMICRLRSFPQYVKSQDGSQRLQLPLERLDFDGVHLGMVRTSAHIPVFEGTTAVQQLPFYPFQSRPDYGTLREELTKRGETLLDLHGRHLKEYRGHALQESSEPGELAKFNSHGRVMLDPATLVKLNPNSALIPSIQTPVQRKDLSSDQKLMLTPLLYGFSLGDKTWGAYGVSSIRPVEWDDAVIDSLVLPPEKKKFIQVLVRKHGNPSSKGSFDDFVKDKGKGLVGLLVGAPGVGKTLTAEVMAEVSHKALYTISSGELGDDSQKVMTRLSSVMELAETWNAVLLLDEADVFLTERDNENLARNAITSVFLRHLEYFQGTMILTTNRLESFDPAFQSRIHFCIEYLELDMDARAQIWHIFKEKAATMGKLEVALNDEDVDRLAKLSLNGRQIKNAMLISQTFAEESQEPLTVSIIEESVDFAQSGWQHTDV